MNVKHYFQFALDLKKVWLNNATEGNLKEIKYIYKVIKENGID